jgi:hypothetical protein
MATTPLAQTIDARVAYFNAHRTLQGMYCEVIEAAAYYTDGDENAALAQMGDVWTAKYHAAVETLAAARYALSQHH